MKKILLGTLLSLLSFNVLADGPIYGSSSNSSGALYVSSQHVLYLPSNNKFYTTIAGGLPQIQLTDTTQSFINMWTYNTGAGSPLIRMGKSGGTTLGTHGITDTNYGAVEFYGDDGTSYFRSAYFIAALASSAGGGSLPSKFIWGTTPSGSTAPVLNMTLDSTGHLTINSTGGIPGFNGSIFPLISDSGITQSSGSIGTHYAGNDALGAHYECGKSRGTTTLAHAAVQANDVLCTNSVQGDDGTNLIRAFEIIGAVDNTVSVGVVPGRGEFWTANATGSMIKRTTIDSQGFTNVTGLAATVGTKFTISGCSASATVGGATAGQFTSGTSGTCAPTITMDGGVGMSAPNGWSCWVNDITTGIAGAQSGSTQTTATLSVATTSGDTVNFGCMGY